MKRKLEINVNICPMPGNNPEVAGRFMVQIQYVQGGAIFTHDNHGKGMDLRAAQDLAFTMRDSLKDEVKKK